MRKHIYVQHTPPLVNLGRISLSPSGLLQVEEMQRRIACVWRYWVWTRPYGRAGEALVCSLRRKLLGRANLVPHMDWATCTLHCDAADALQTAEGVREGRESVGR